MGTEIVKFIINALKKDDCLSKTWSESRAIRWETAIGCGIIIALVSVAPGLLADWYQQSLFSFGKPIGWLWGFWGLMPLSAFAFHAAITVSDINSHYLQRYAQSKLLTNHGGGDDIFAKFMSEFDVQKKYAPGAPEERLVRNVFLDIFAAGTTALLFCPIALLPAAVITAFFPGIFIPLVAITLTFVAVTYMVFYGLNGPSISLFYTFANIPIFVAFFHDGLVASVATYFSIYLGGAIGTYVMSKLVWASYKSKPRT